MSYQIENESLRSSYERQLESDRDPSQDEALLQALVETVANSDIPEVDRLKATQAALMGMLKMKQERRKMDLDTGRLMSLETASYVANQYVGVVLELFRSHLPPSTFNFVVDSVPLALYDTAKQDEKLRKFVFPTSATWKQSEEMFEGANRAKLLEKIGHERALTQKDETRYLENN